MGKRPRCSYLNLGAASYRVVSTTKDDRLDYNEREVRDYKRRLEAQKATSSKPYCYILGKKTFIKEEQLARYKAASIEILYE